MRLADASKVVTPIQSPRWLLSLVLRAARTRTPARSGRRALGRTGRHAFTLTEMLIVISLIAILAALAIPNASDARYDRHVYDDAGWIAQMFRQARSRALSRGAAVIVVATTNGTTDRGTVNVYESVAPGTYNPISTCKSPSTWNLSTASFTTTTNGMNWVASANLNGAIEGLAGIQTTFNAYAGSNGTVAATPTNVTSFAICYTPLGHAYYAPNVSGSTVVYDTAIPMTGAVNINVQRTVSTQAGSAVLGLARTVVVPPNGMARVVVAATAVGST